MDRRLVSVIDGKSDGRFVVGGLLPAGAMRALAIDARGETVAATCADGGWTAVVEAGPWPDVPVRFEDAAGAIVRPAAWALVGAVGDVRVTIAGTGSGPEGLCLRAGGDEFLVAPESYP